MDGLLDFLKTSEGQGLLAAGFGGLANARRNAPLNALGAAGLAGMQGYASAQDRQMKIAEDLQMRQLREQQLRQAKYANEQLDADRKLNELAQQYYKPQQTTYTPITGATDGNTWDIKETPAGFDQAGFMAAAKAMNPIKAAALAKSLQGEQEWKEVKRFDKDNNIIHGVINIKSPNPASTFHPIGGEPERQKMEMVNLGGALRPMNLFTGSSTGADIPTILKPDTASEIASRERIANQSNATTIRGQNLQDARENLVPLETPTGYQAFSKKTGMAAPIMSGGQQLQQKDSPLVANQRLQGQLAAGIEEARKLIPVATSSGAGALADVGMGFFGKSTAGGDAAQQLETLAGWMTSNVPRMQGPQSDKDVLLYKQMAAEVGNRNKPVSARMAALDTLEKLQAKYADINGTTNPMAPTKANAEAQKQKTIVRTGVSNGRKVVQYSDGSVSYAD